MTNKPELKIEAGRFYRDGTGGKWEAVKVISGDRFCVLALSFDLGRRSTRWFEIDGKSPAVLASDYNLISEWIDAPEVDWSMIPIWYVALAMDRNQEWRAFIEKPTILAGGDTWLIPGTFYQPGVNVIVVPRKYAPKFNGDWKESLVCRPGVEK